MAELSLTGIIVLVITGVVIAVCYVQLPAAVVLDGLSHSLLVQQCSSPALTRASCSQVSATATATVAASLRLADLTATTLMLANITSHYTLYRYKLALELRPQWEKGYFWLGQYMDFLFRSRVEELHRLRQQQQHRHDESSSSGSSGSGSSRSKQQSSKSKHSAAAAAAAAIASTQGWHDDDLAHRYALETMDSYARGLRVSALYC
jgi:hypothetical protein